MIAFHGDQAVKATYLARVTGPPQDVLRAFLTEITADLERFAGERFFDHQCERPRKALENLEVQRTGDHSRHHRQLDSARRRRDTAGRFA